MSVLPRERLLSDSAVTLEDLIAILIGSGNGQHSVFSLANTVAQRLQGGISLKESLVHISGLGNAGKARLLAAERLAGQLALANASPILSLEDVEKHCHWLTLADREHFVGLYLNTRLSIIKAKILSIGTVSASLVHPREAFREAILCCATAVVFVHNHPSGDARASEADISSTKLLVAAGKQLAIPVLDHVIISSQGSMSLKVSQSALFW